MKLIKTLAILLVVVVVFGAAIFALDLHTGPIIEENNKGEFGDDVLLYSTDAPGELRDVPEQVLAIYQRAEGFAIQAKTIGNYVKEPIILTVTVSADGKIENLDINEYTDSIDVRNMNADFIPSFIGKDSALADVNLVSGCTFSSKAIKEAVEAGLNALISNNLITAGKKDDSQILTELIPTVHVGMTSNGALKAKEVTPSGNITLGYAAENGTGFALVVKNGDTSVLAVLNAMGVCKVYDVEGKDVTASNEAVVTEAKAFADANKTDYSKETVAKFTAMLPGAADFAPVEIDSFNSIVYATSFKLDGATYYGFYSTAIGYEKMDVYVVIDENGAITKFEAKELIFHIEYFGTFDAASYDATAYKNGFVGLTGETFTDDKAMISSATMSSNGVKTAIKDAFDAFNVMKNGGAN